MVMKGALFHGVATLALIGGIASAAEAQSSPAPSAAAQDQTNGDAVVQADGKVVKTANDTDARQQPEPEADSRPNEILVTGSRIRRSDLTTAAPITIIDKDMIGERGLGRLSDTLSAMPQITPLIGDRGSSLDPRAGAARVSLRGLGPGRTLTLLNGERFDNDANVIPAPLIERVDVLTGGASAVYGSDAIAGVVNYILKRRFTGLQVNLETSAQQTTNDNRFMLDLLEDAGYPRPPRHAFGGETYFGSLTAGQNFAGDRGNISAFVTYNRMTPININMFDHTACRVFLNPQNPVPEVRKNDQFACGFNEANPYSYFYAGDSEWTNARDGSRTWRPYDPADIQRVPQTDWLQRKVNRVNTGGFFSFDFNPSLKFDSSFLYSSDKSGGEVALTDWFYVGDTQMPCDNPFMSAQQAQIVCGANAGVAGTSAPFTMSLYRPGNTSSFAYNLDTWRAAGHLSGNLTDDVRFDASIQRSKRIEQYTGTNIFDYWGMNQYFARAVQVVNVNGVPTCQSVVDGSDPACIPLDPFRVGGPSDAVWPYLTRTGSSRVAVEQLVATGSIAGTLENIGLKSPWADDGVGFALVAEHRWNRVTESGAGAFDWWSKYSGVDTVDEVGGELSLPIAQNRRFLEDLTVSGAYRVSRYKSLPDAVQTWKLDAVWRPFGGLGFRGSINRALRRGFLERLQGANPYQGDFEDRCAQALPASDGSVRQRLSFDQCAAVGLTRAQYDALATPGNCNAAGNCQTLYRPGGNPDLRPETSRSITAGVVMQPKFLPGLNASVDFFSIRINGAFEWVRTDIIADQCFAQRVAFFCGLITRDPASGRVTEINARYNNSGFSKTEGIDFSLFYPIALSKDRIGTDLGRINLGLNGTVNTADQRQFAPNTPIYSCLGRFGFLCRGPSPRYRHFASLGWDMPWKGNITLAWRYAAPTRNSKLAPEAPLKSVPNAGNTDTYPLIPRLAAQSLFDLSIRYPISRDVDIWANSQNIFDKDPPIVGGESEGSGAFQNTYPWYYNTWGRTLRVGVRMKLW